MLTAENRSQVKAKIKEALENVGFIQSKPSFVPTFTKSLHFNDFDKHEITYLTVAEIFLQTATHPTKETNFLYKICFTCSYVNSENNITSEYNIFLFKMEDLDNLNTEIEKCQDTLSNIFDAIGRPGAVQMNALGDRN